MAQNVLSNSIRIFPSSGRSSDTNRYGDNFVTEYNLSSIVNKLLQPGLSGFIISDSTGSNYDGVAEFNIHGYFISVDSWNSIINAATGAATGGNNYQNFVTFSLKGANQIVATIRINSAGELSYNNLVGSDGVSADSSNSGGTPYTLSLLRRRSTGSNWYLDPSSKLRLTNFAIDDGVL